MWKQSGCFAGFANRKPRRGADVVVFPRRRAVRSRASDKRLSPALLQCPRHSLTTPLLPQRDNNTQTLSTMADDDGETPRMSTDAFSRLKVADMKAVLKELHDSKQHGKVKRSGKKNDLINEFRRVHGEEVEPSEPEDEEDAEPSAEKLRKIAQAEAIMASLIIPSDRTISKSTKQVMRDMRYASTKYGLREDDLSDNLEVSDIHDVV
jgi:hypothetical protein